MDAERVRGRGRRGRKEGKEGEEKEMARIFRRTVGGGAVALVFGRFGRPSPSVECVDSPLEKTRRSGERERLRL